MLLFSFLPVAAVVFTPAYPALALEFGLLASQDQWMMTIFLLGATFGRLPYGPLANRFGRKKTLYLGLSIALLGTIMILVAGSYFWLCVGRWVQALGCAVTMKIGYTMIADLHAGALATKIMSYGMLAYAILPGISTGIAGHLTEHFGWKGSFWFFLVFNLLVILSCFYLPETSKKKDLHALKIKKIITGYAAQFKDRNLVLWGSLMGLSTAILFIFSQQAPFIGIEMMGLTPREYGWFYLVPSMGIAAGSLLTVYLSDRMTAKWGMFWGIVGIATASLLMQIFFLGSWISGWALFLPQVVVQLGDALLYNNASSIAVSEAKDKSNASSIVLFINSCWAVFGTFLVGVFDARAFLSLPLIFLSISVLMFIFWGMVRANKKVRRDELTEIL
jgi:MFS family permease